MKGTLWIMGVLIGLLASEVGQAQDNAWLPPDTAGQTPQPPPPQMTLEEIDFVAGKPIKAKGKLWREAMKRLVEYRHSVPVETWAKQPIPSN